MQACKTKLTRNIPNGGPGAGKLIRNRLKTSRTFPWISINRGGEKKNPIRRARASHACMRLRPGTVRTVRLVQRRRIQRKIPVRGKEKSAAAGARRGAAGQTPPRHSRARTHTCGRSQHSRALTCQAMHARPPARACASPSEFQPAATSNRAQGYAGSGGSLGLLAL